MFIVADGGLSRMAPLVGCFGSLGRFTTVLKHSSFSFGFCLFGKTWVVMRALARQDWRAWHDGTGQDAIR